jgi:hypothetical protein
LVVYALAKGCTAAVPAATLVTGFPAGLLPALRTARLSATAD